MCPTIIITWSVFVALANVFAMVDEPAASTPKELIAALSGNSGIQKVKACESIEKIGVGAKPCVPALIAVLSDRSKIGRSFSGELFATIASDSPAAAAARALGAIGPDATLATKQIVELLKSGEEYERIAAARALCLINPSSAGPALTAALRKANKPSVERAILLGCRARVNPVILSDVKQLAEMLDHEDWETATRAAWELQSLGIKAKPATDALLARLEKLLAGDVPFHGGTVAIPALVLAISVIEYEEAFEVIAQAYHQSKSEAQYQAEFMTAFANLNDPRTVPLLMEGLSNLTEFDAGFRTIVQALSDLGPEARAALPLLKDKLTLARKLRHSDVVQLLEIAIQKLESTK